MSAAAPAHSLGAKAALVALAFVLGLAPGAAAEEPAASTAPTARSASELLERFQEFQAEGDLGGLASLYYEERTPDAILERISERRRTLIGLTITEARLEAIDPQAKEEAMAGFQYRDKSLAPNLEPIARATFVFDTSTQGPMKVTSRSMLIGEADGVHYFVLPGEFSSPDLELAEDVASFNVIILGLGGSDPVRYTGSCTYLSLGEERTKELGGAGSQTWAFGAAALTRCEVTQTSANGFLRLKIVVDGDTVFESRKTEGRETVVYEKPAG